MQGQGGRAAEGGLAGGKVTQLVPDPSVVATSSAEDPAGNPSVIPRYVVTRMIHHVATRARSSDAASRRGRELTELVLRELRAARMDRNISGAAVAVVLGISASQFSRLERGRTSGVSIEDACVALDAVGLDLVVKTYPGGPPIRDAAHTALLDRLRPRCHASIRLLTEVGMPIAGDQRAWDLVAVGPAWRHRFEAETRARDCQALTRRIRLKARDSGDIGGVSLLLLDSRHNRDFVAMHAATLAETFPVPASVALAALRTGADPGAGSVILL